MLAAQEFVKFLNNKAMVISSILAPSWEFMRQNLKTMKALPCKAL